VDADAEILSVGVELAGSGASVPRTGTTPAGPPTALATSMVGAGGAPLWPERRSGSGRPAAVRRSAPSSVATEPVAGDHLPFL
jgi:hypothetical protein